MLHYDLRLSYKDSSVIFTTHIFDNSTDLPTDRQIDQPTDRLEVENSVIDPQGVVHSCLPRPFLSLDVCARHYTINTNLRLCYSTTNVPQCYLRHIRSRRQPTAFK